MSKYARLAAVWLWALGGVALYAGEPSAPVPVGVAKVDITPDYPVRLAGYSSRSTPSEGVAQRLFTKALAIGSDEGEGPAVLITVDNCGVPAVLVEKVRKRLQDSGVRGDRLVVCSSHAHSAPWLMGYAPFLATEPPPDNDQRARARYTRQLEDWMVQVAQRALQQRQPARLYRTEGRVTFAANRRVVRNAAWTGFGVQPNAPVDHRLPVLVVKNTAGQPVAIWATYACHCTTLGGEFNQICGDWSGFAQHDIEADFPSAISLISIGCGADANPEPRGKFEYAPQHGRALANEVKRLLGEDLTAVPATVTCRRKQIELPFDKLPDRETWEKLAQVKGSQHYAAQEFLGMLARGEAIPQTLPYPVATWSFGDKLAMVFLGGEVVVDYAIRIGQEFDKSRVWVVAYSNDVPCYIASKRILREGGYEADTSMIYYGRPTRLAPPAEDLILQTVHELLPAGYAKSAQ